MMGLIIVIHVIACVSLIVIVLIQRGKGGGLLESFSGLETMFGTKTSAFLTKATTIFSVIFFMTCLLLTFLSVKRSKSLMEGVKVTPSKPAETIAVNNEQPKTKPAAEENKAAQKTP